MKNWLLYLSTGATSFYILYKYYQYLLCGNYNYYVLTIKDYSCRYPYPYENDKMAEYLIKTYNIDEILKEYEKINEINSQYIVFETEICSLRFEKGENEKNNESLVFIIY